MYRWTFALLVVFSSVLQAGGWAPIPASTWDIREDAKAGIQGAIVLDEFARYGVRDSEFSLRILVLSEAGKSAVQLDPFPDELISLEGRTVLPDGRVVEFSKTKDFSEQTVDSNRFSSKRKVVVPPGVTSHCVLDIKWTLRSTYLWGDRFTRGVQRSYPIIHLELELSKMSPMGSVLLVPPSMRPVISEDSGYRTYTFKNLPALDDQPYTRWGLRSWPRLLCFMQPRGLYESLDKAPGVYWNKAVDLIIKPNMTSLDTGRAFSALEKEIFAELPSDPLQKSAIILDRLNSKIRNTGWMTAAERATRTKKEDGEYIHANDLNESVKRGWTNGSGMYYLAFQLFKDANLHPKLQFVSDRDSSAFRYDLKDFYQFDNVLIGIATSDGKGMGWYDPSNRYLPPGIVDPSYQGVWGLQIDTDTWTTKPEIVPSQRKEANQRHDNYDITLDADAIQFKSSSSFKGYEDYVARFPYYELGVMEASKKLKEAWEAGLPSYSITKAMVQNASDRNHTISIEVDGRKEQDGGRRVVLSPFPGKERPLWVPSSWPTTRSENIVMAYKSINSADATIHMPKGWVVSAMTPIQFTSKLGTVTWTCTQEHEAEGETVKVHFDVQVDSMFMPPSEVGTLKAFLGAMEEAWNRTLSLEHAR